MIENKSEYYEFIIKQGVGKKDIVESSPDSYVSYLNSVSKLLNKDISSSLISCEKDILHIIEQLQGKKAKKTLDNYKTALTQYLKFLKDKE